tara:strand:- start:618 stop:1295 length:678 start_codon:yes stop_codon:yes gene_type:complete
MYFNADTQAAICDYQDAEDINKKNDLYVEKILPAFDKLVQNLIFIYGFATPAEPVEHLKSDCISFLFETLHKWDRHKGTKAFSYFNVVGKNWLIINSRRRQKNTRRHVSVDAPESMSMVDKMAVANHDIILPPDELMIKKDFRGDIMKILLEIQKKVTGENEKKCMHAVVKVFESIDDLDYLNKRAIFVYVREISGLNPKQLSVAMSIIRKHYKALAKTEDYGLF